MDKEILAAIREQTETNLKILAGIEMLNRNLERYLAIQVTRAPGVTKEIERLARRTPEQIKADNKLFLKSAPRRDKK